jgi:hypothetical protein
MPPPGGMIPYEIYDLASPTLNGEVWRGGGMSLRGVCAVALEFARAGRQGANRSVASVASQRSTSGAKA